VVLVDTTLKGGRKCTAMRGQQMLCGGTQTHPIDSQKLERVDMASAVVQHELTVLRTNVGWRSSCPLRPHGLRDPARVELHHSMPSTQQKPLSTSYGVARMCFKSVSWLPIPVRLSMRLGRPTGHMLPDKVRCIAFKGATSHGDPMPVNL
jgi:hypothetical protein